MTLSQDLLQEVFGVVIKYRVECKVMQVAVLSPGMVVEVNEILNIVV